MADTVPCHAVPRLWPTLPGPLCQHHPVCSSPPGRLRAPCIDPTAFCTEDTYCKELLESKPKITRVVAGRIIVLARRNV